MVKVIAFDADDTLWHNETLFQLTQEKFAGLLADYHSTEWIMQKLFETEMKNLRYFGYGIKGFTLSLIETAIQLTEGRIAGSEIQKIIDYARQMVEAPVELLAHVKETITGLADTYSLMVITKGDLLDQESKIARSGLSRFFKYIEIVSDKNADVYRGILQKHNIKASNFLMVGNSLKSDVLPVLETGAGAVYIPYHICWEHEKAVEPATKTKNYLQLEHIGQLPGLLKQRT
ncbi:MAG: HAD hydrolase-like protein [bacterium]|nr:HAD hydrolase-like protein [bacterium]